MSQEQAQRAIQALYADPDVRDELTDDEAQVLLGWAENCVHDLAARELDDTQFEEVFAHLRRLVTRMNRYTGRRTDLTTDEQQALLARITESSQAAGISLSAEQLAAFQQTQQAVADNVAHIQALTGLFRRAPSADQSAPPTASPPDEHTNVSPSPYTAK